MLKYVCNTWCNLTHLLVHWMQDQHAPNENDTVRSREKNIETVVYSIQTCLTECYNDFGQNITKEEVRTCLSDLDFSTYLFELLAGMDPLHTICMDDLHAGN